MAKKLVFAFELCVWNKFSLRNSNRTYIIEKVKVLTVDEKDYIYIECQPFHTKMTLPFTHEVLKYD